MAQPRFWYVADVVVAMSVSLPLNFPLGSAQVNGGANVAEKVDFAYKHFEQPIPIDAVLRKDEMIDTIAITRGRGTEGVVTRWGVTRLPRKTHRGLRKVSCSASPFPHAANANVQPMYSAGACSIDLIHLHSLARRLF